MQLITKNSACTLKYYVSLHLLLRYMSAGAMEIGPWIGTEWLLYDLTLHDRGSNFCNHFFPLIAINTETLMTNSLYPYFFH